MVISRTIDCPVACRGVVRFLKTGIWEIRLKDQRPIKAFSLLILRVILLASRKFVTDRCQQTASVLTYYSLLNIVPVVAVAFAIAKGFGLRKVMEKQILQIADKANLQPDITAQILAFSQKLLEQAKGGLIAGVGVILLLWTVISILGKIEDSFNDIWEIRNSRTLFRKFSDYIAMMVFGPVLVAIAGSATVLMAGHVPVVFDIITFLGPLGKVFRFAMNLLPYVSVWVLFTILYLVMPNTRIPVKTAIVGGIAAGTIAQIVQWAYIKFQIGVASQGAIYGSFAAIPLFLGWLQMSWMIALFGAEVAYAAEYYETYGFHPDYAQLSVSSRKFLMLRIFHLLTKRFAVGEKPLTTRQVAHTLEIPEPVVKHVMRELGQIGLVVETAQGMRSETAFQPGRTIEDITVKFLLDEYEKYGYTGLPGVESADAVKISQYLKDISETVEKSPANVYLREI